MRCPDLALIGVWNDREPLGGYPGRITLIQPGNSMRRVDLHRKALIAVDPPCIILDGRHEPGPTFDWETVCDGIYSVVNMVEPPPDLLLLNGASPSRKRKSDVTIWQAVQPFGCVNAWSGCTAYYVRSAEASRAIIVSTQTESNLPWSLHVASTEHVTYGAVTPLFVKE